MLSFFVNDSNYSINLRHSSWLILYWKHELSCMFWLIVQVENGKKITLNQLLWIIEWMNIWNANGISCRSFGAMSLVCYPHLRSFFLLPISYLYVLGGTFVIFFYHFPLIGWNPIKKETLCTSLQFRCGDGTCLDRSKLCNGRAECIDSSDEFNCVIRKIPHR